MIIKRVRIEGGFLNGFDLRLAPGLNVLIGARGTGKTSVIELVRFALDAKNHTQEAEGNSRAHAQAVLDEGEILVELMEGSREIVVTRAQNDQHPQATGPFQAPIVLSQTEIETVGLSEGGRLALVDGFVADISALRTSEAAAVSAVKTAFKEIDALQAEIAGMSEGGPNEALVVQQLKTLEADRAKLQKGLGESAGKQKQSDELAGQIARISVAEDVVAQFARDVGNWKEGIESLWTEHPGPADWDHVDAKDPLDGLRSQFDEALDTARLAATRFSRATAKADERRAKLREERGELEKKARAIRADLEQLTEGAGRIARQMSSLQTTLAQIQARNKLIREKQTRLESLKKRRDEKVAVLSEIRHTRFNRRSDTAQELSVALGPHIRVEVDQATRYSEYQAALVSALRGGGLRYADMVNRVVERVSPRELLQFVESGEFQTLASILEISPERTARLIGQIREHGLAEIATANVEDDVRMSLLDGVGYKEIGSLSAGQRCTVVLSIVMQHKERTLVIDQPEDHLDNAFIASTVINSLRGRQATGQVLLSTHNANIPVLGEAQLVIQLTSDGRNGFIQVCKPLGHPEAVRAITSVMEGGREAFAARANFYRTHAE
jgi:energy-coupling factor transporter ATP-binding protein EcfA2